MELASGTRVGRYVVETRIGRGGMASVFRVRHTDLGTRFALKLLDVRAAALRDRLLAEGRMQASLQHPNVVAVTDVVVHEGCPGLVMEYVDGPSLKALIAAGPVPPTVRDELVTGILHGVRAAHKLGFVHRDLKPANILLARTDDRLVPKVADFGLAKAAADDDDLRRTRSGVMFGTPAYMAPEQARSARDVDQRADVFALGVVLYELCTGRLPVESEDLFELFGDLVARRYPRPRELVPDLPEHVEETILAALEPNRDDRIPDCDVLLASWRGQVRFQPDELPVVPLTSPIDRGYLQRVAALGVGDGTSETPVPARRDDPAPAEPALAPRREGPLRRLAVVLGGVGALGAVATSAVGLLLLAVIAVASIARPTAAPPPAGEAPEVAVAPLPAAPSPAPVTAEPVVVAPTPRPEPRPGPRPHPAAPAPKEVPMGTLRVTGDPTRSATLRGPHGPLSPGPVPAGVYELEVKFADGGVGTLRSIVVPPGGSVVVECHQAFWSCKTL